MYLAFNLLIVKLDKNKGEKEMKDKILKPSLLAIIIFIFSLSVLGFLMKGNYISLPKIGMKVGQVGKFKPVEIVDYGIEIAHTHGDHTYYDWKVTLKNPNKIPMPVRIELYLLAEDGFELDHEFRDDIIEGEREKTITTPTFLETPLLIETKNTKVEVETLDPNEYKELMETIYRFRAEERKRKIIEDWKKDSQLYRYY